MNPESTICVMDNDFGIQLSTSRCSRSPWRIVLCYKPISLNNDTELVLCTKSLQLWACPETDTDLRNKIVQIDLAGVSAIAFTSSHLVS